MLGLPPNTRVWSAAGHTDTRKGFDGLAALVQRALHADPFAGDRLGRLKLSTHGLARRDHLVLATCRDAGLPAAITMAGGYAREVDDIVDIHLRTVEIAAALAQEAREGLPGAVPGVVQASTPRP